MENFYQNHRRYVKSRSNEQLLGAPLPVGKDKIEEDLADCAPILTNAQAEVTMAVDGVTTLDPAAAAYPCGLVAKSFFNDTFALYNSEPDPLHLDNPNTKLVIDDSDIAWESDVKYKFFNIKDDPAWDTVQWHDVTDRK